MKYISRIMEKEISEASKNYPVIMVCGQRQAGKSTMLNQIKELNRRFVSFDELNVRRLALNDPDLFFDTYKYPIIIDEFQKVPSILEKIKEIVDRLAIEGWNNNGLFWLTSSQKFKMMGNVSESLAGRVSLYELSSLSFKEIYDVDDSGPFTPNLEVLKAKKPIPLDVNEVFNNIFKGGMPRIIRNGINREKYYSDYIATYIERDIREMQAIGKLNEFYDFLVFMASRTAQELHYDEIAKKIGISAPTAKEWVSILERSGLIFILRPYYKDIASRLVLWFFSLHG